MVVVGVCLLLVLIGLLGRLWTGLDGMLNKAMFYCAAAVLVGPVLSLSPVGGNGASN